MVPNPVQNPYLFGWYNFAAKFTEQVKQSWPAEKSNFKAPKVDKKDQPKQAPAPQKAEEQKQEAKPKKEKQPKAPKTPAASADSGSSVPAEYQAFCMSDLRVAKIVECKVHPDSDKLYVEQIDCGEGRLRTIGSGLQKFCTMEDMTTGLCVVYANLKPRKLADLMSEGMVLCAGNDDHTQIEIMRPPEGAKVGERLTLEGNPAGEMTQDFQPVLNPKKKIAEQVLPLLKTNGDCYGTFNGVRLMTSAGPIKSKTLKNSGIS